MTTALPRSALIKPYYPAFDGLRAVAFLMVFVCHYVIKVFNIAIFRWGWVGTDLFFALSGFLITGILFDSIDESHYFRTFYVRRTLRIFPLFYSFWLLLLLLTPWLHIEWNRYNFALAAYIGNNFIASGLHHADPAVITFQSIRHPGLSRVIPVSHLWTLCVEEQFYLVWPAVLFLVRSRRKLLWLCLAGIALLLSLRFAIACMRPDLLSAGLLYTSTWSHSDGLLAGSALALWLRGSSPSLDSLRLGAIMALFVSVLLIAVTVPMPTQPIDNFRVCTYGFSLVAVASVSLLVLALSSRWLSFLLESRPMIATGRISYGLYFFHVLPFIFVVGLISQARSKAIGVLIVTVTFAWTYAAAWCSYRFLESPFLRLKSRVAARPHAIADPPADTGEITDLVPSSE